MIIFFFSNDPAAPEIYTLSLHDALPILTLPLSRCAHALLERRAASPARIGGGNELDARRKVADSSPAGDGDAPIFERDRKSTRLNSSHVKISYAVFCLKKKKL